MDLPSHNAFPLSTFGMWVGAHVAIVLLLQTGMSSATAFFVLPVGFGAVQFLFLRRQLRVAWLWPLLTFAGIFVAMILGLGWFWIPAIGLGFGVAQLPLLLGRGFRFAPLWALGSGLGWVAGFLLNPLMERIQVFLTNGPSSGSPNFWTLYLPVALTYSTATGFYLHHCSPGPNGTSNQPATSNPEAPKTVLT